MNLNERPCWLQVNRCGRTNGLPGHLCWRPPGGRHTPRQRWGRVTWRKYRNLVVSLYSLTFGFAIVYSWYLCLRPPGGSRGRDIEWICWRKTPGLALSISRSVQAIRANIHVCGNNCDICVQIHTLCVVPISCIYPPQSSLVNEEATSDLSILYIGFQMLTYWVSQPGTLVFENGRSSCQATLTYKENWSMCSWDFIHFITDAEHFRCFDWEENIFEINMKLKFQGIIFIRLKQNWMLSSVPRALVQRTRWNQLQFWYILLINLMSPLDTPVLLPMTFWKRRSLVTIVLERRSLLKAVCRWAFQYMQNWTFHSGPIISSVNKKTIHAMWYKLASASDLN